jgi:hypothetical protein
MASICCDNGFSLATSVIVAPAPAMEHSQNSATPAAPPPNQSSAKIRIAAPDETQGGGENNLAYEAIRGRAGAPIKMRVLFGFWCKQAWISILQ